MDDLTVGTESVPSCRWTLQGPVKLVELARMQFNPTMSRSIGVEERRGGGVQIQLYRHSHPYHHKETSQELRQSFLTALWGTLLPSSLTALICDVWLKAVDKPGLSWKAYNQSLDVQHSPSNPLAHLFLCRASLNSWISREGGQQPRQKMAKAAKEFE